jgi:hypothetical protein
MFRRRAALGRLAALVNSGVLAHATRNAFLGSLAVEIWRRAADPRRVRELEQALPPSAITLHNEAFQRRAEELGPIEGF